ncbi:DUF7344 domain-containing protein [Halobaculum marinum]|uniref:DUF7344 domain-containing protein n=1 Tax=Halobaculum marinum TaxID=3031996 RepID=A0ABD5WS66_9EURY|nr:hypothetical protein [Halobaculum sp. DT55]
MVYSRTESATKNRHANDLTESEWHDLLASARRRAVLSVVEESRETIELEALAARVAETLDDATVDDERDLVISLHHVHLPKLSDFGVITYDPVSGWVDPTPSK